MEIEKMEFFYASVVGKKIDTYSLAGISKPVNVEPEPPHYSFTFHDISRLVPFPNDTQHKIYIGYWEKNVQMENGSPVGRFVLCFPSDAGKVNTFNSKCNVSLPNISSIVDTNEAKKVLAQLNPHANTFIPALIANNPKPSYLR